MAGVSLLLSSVPDYSGGTAPDSHRVPDCLGSLICHTLSAHPRLVKGKFDIREVGRKRVKGKSAEITVYEVL